MDLMIVPHVAIDLAELAEYQTTLIADLSVRLHRKERELAQLKREE